MCVHPYVSLIMPPTHLVDTELPTHVSSSQSHQLNNNGFISAWPLSSITVSYIQRLLNCEANELNVERPTRTNDSPNPKARRAANSQLGVLAFQNKVRASLWGDRRSGACDLWLSIALQGSAGCASPPAPVCNECNLEGVNLGAERANCLFSS